MTAPGEVRRVVDLSVPVGPGTPVHPGDPEPHLDVHATVARDGYNLLAVRMGSQTGTHVDAPYHVRDDAPRVDEVDLRRFVGPAVVVDATGLPPRGRVGVAHLAPVVDRLRPGVVVLLHTGWSAYRGDDRYLAHPALDPDACRRLLDAGVRTIGVDAPSIDETPASGAVGGLPCHHLVAEAGGIIAENLTDLAEVERMVDPLVCLFPIRLEGADGAPVRAVAIELGPEPGRSA